MAWECWLPFPGIPNWAGFRLVYPLVYLEMVVLQEAVDSDKDVAGFEEGNVHVDGIVLAENLRLGVVVLGVLLVVEVEAEGIPDSPVGELDILECFAVGTAADST